MHRSSSCRFVLAAAFVLFVALLSSGVTLAAGVVVLDGPTLTMDPNGTTPLAGVVELETDSPVSVQLSITDGIDAWVVSPPLIKLQHYIPVLGLKPGRTYTVDVILIPGGNVGTVFATTPALPADFPQLLTVVSNPALMEPGYTITDCLRRANGDARPTYSIMVDSAGDLVWYTTHCMVATTYLPNGSILYRNEAVAIEMDFLGNQKRVTLAFPGLGAHHDLLRTPHGTYLSMDRQNVPIDDFPTSDTDPNAPSAPATLRDDLIVEFLPDGTLRREWPTVDLVDVTRIGFDSLNVIADGYDWTHGNAAHYRLSDDSIIISLRQQDAVVKFSRATGEVEWILGPHDNWSAAFDQYLLMPIGSPFRWQYHQHAPMWTAPNRVVLYDNGNHRASPFDGTVPLTNDQNFSRGVEYEINEGNLTVRQVWEYGENIADPLFTAFIGDADWQPATGNRLMTYGAVSYVGGVPSADLGFGLLHARLVETTSDVVPVKVFELVAYDPVVDQRIIIYRSERIPSLYPQVYFDPPNGVGDTLIVDKNAGGETMSWTASPVDPTHSAAEHYRVYTSTSPGAGFGMAESNVNTSFETDLGPAAVTYIRVVAANMGGTSGDEPNP